MYTHHMQSCLGSMMSLVLSVTVCFLLFTSIEGVVVDGSFTSGFPTLDALRGNGSLLDRFSTHDGEWRSVPGVSVSEECSTESVMITRVSFIALPGVGNKDTKLVFTHLANGSMIYTIPLNTRSVNQSFGKFGYEVDQINFELVANSILWTLQPNTTDSALRMLYQMGDEKLNISRSSRLEEEPDSAGNETTYDYPLLAIETDPPGCIDGLLSTTELRNMWENRPSPVVYSSPYREIPLNCSGPGNLTRLLAATQGPLPGDQSPQVEVDQNVPNCSLSSQPALDEDLNVYECVPDSPVEVSESDSILILQRHSDTKIVFLHDGQTDTPLISTDIDGDCRFSGLSEDDLREKAAQYTHRTVHFENDLFKFRHLNITQAGYLSKWTFAARDRGEVGSLYPGLIVFRNGEKGKSHPLPLMSSDPAPTIYPNVHESTIHPPLLVQAGDFIGLDLPSIENALLLLSFLTKQGSVGEGIFTGAVQVLPLVSLQIAPLTTSASSLLHSSMGTPYSSVVVPHTELVASSPSSTLTLIHPLSSTGVTLSTLPSSTLSHVPILTPVPCVQPETDTLCVNSAQETNRNASSGTVIIAVASSLCLLSAATIAIILTCMWFRKRRPKLVGNVVYDSTYAEIMTDVNEAYDSISRSDVKTNPAYATTSLTTHHPSSPHVDSSMSPNKTSGHAVSHNPTYDKAASASSPLYEQLNDGNHLYEAVDNTCSDKTAEYDYIVMD